MSIDRDRIFWDRSAKSYAEKSVSDEAGYRRTIDRTRHFLTATDRVLELGCGTGATALRLADGVRSYLGTDISPAMIQICNEKKQLAAAGRRGGQDGGGSPPSSLTFRAATVDVLAEEEARFDVVLGFNYLHLVRDLAGTLARIYLLLEDDGLFISKTGLVRDMNLLMQWALPPLRAMGMAPHVTMFSEEELRDEIRAAGFDIVEVEMHASNGDDRRRYIVARKGPP